MDDGTTGITIRKLVHDHYQIVYRFALRLSGSAVDAEDLTQQTFLTACRKIDQLREADRARSWLFTIVRNCFLKSRRNPEAELPDEGRQITAPDLHRLPDEFDEERLQQALNELPESHRTAVLLFYFEELSYKQIAEVLDSPVGTVMSRLSRAKQHLRARLTEPIPPLAEVRPSPD